MANATLPARRSLPALFVLVLVLSLALSNDAEALQCPKGYGGHQGRCVPNAETAKKLYQKQQHDAAAAKRKQAEAAAKIKAAKVDGYGKWGKSGANSAQPNPPKNTKPVDVTNFGKYTKSANTAKPNVPDNKDAKSVGKSKGAPDNPTSFNSPKPNTPAGPRNGISSRPNIPERPSANSTKPNVPDNSKTTEKTTEGQKSGNKWMTNSSGPNVPNNDDRTGNGPGKGKRERADDDRGDRKTAKARDDDDDKPSPKAKQKRAADDDDGGTRKSAKASGDDDGGKRKSAKASGDDDNGARGKPATTASIGAAAGGSGWTHNDSRMSVADDGKQLTIAYDAPRNGLSDLGIKPGTPLFKGTRDGNKVSGEATTFTRKCGTRTYPVSGTADGGRVELSGDKPVLGGDCSVTGTRREVMVFETGG